MIDGYGSMLRRPFVQWTTVHMDRERVIVREDRYVGAISSTVFMGVFASVVAFHFAVTGYREFALVSAAGGFAVVVAQLFWILRRHPGRIIVEIVKRHCHAKYPVKCIHEEDICSISVRRHFSFDEDDYDLCQIYLVLRDMPEGFLIHQAMWRQHKRELALATELGARWNVVVAVVDGR